MNRYLIWASKTLAAILTLIQKKRAGFWNVTGYPEKADLSLFRHYWTSPASKLIFSHLIINKFPAIFNNLMNTY